MSVDAQREGDVGMTDDPRDMDEVEARLDQLRREIVARLVERPDDGEFRLPLRDLKRAKQVALNEGASRVGREDAGSVGNAAFPPSQK